MKLTLSSLIMCVALLFLTACANKRIVLPPEVFQEKMTQLCEKNLPLLKGTDGASVMITLQQWGESYRRCEALNNSKAQYMLQLQEIFKTHHKLIKY